MNHKKITAIIPMRAGSQRVKNKNIRIVNGRYLFEYIIDTILKLNEVTEILINTDISTIKNVINDCNKIKFIDRPENMKGNCNINDVIENSIRHTENDYFIQVHVTNPLLTHQTLGKAIARYFKYCEKFDSMFGVTRVQKRFWKSDCSPFNHELSDEPTTQNLEVIFEENSCLYIFSRDSFNKNKNRIGKTPSIFEIPKLEAWDIDDEQDLKIVQNMLVDPKED